MPIIRAFWRGRSAQRSSLTLAETNLIVIRVGDGAQTQTLNGNSMYLDQYDLSGSYVNTVTVPDSGPSALVAIGLDNLTGVNSGSTTGSPSVQPRS